MREDRRLTPVDAPRRSGPGHDPAAFTRHGEPRLMLEPVVVPAEQLQVALTRRAATVAAPGISVVEIATRRSPAPGEAAASVAQLHEGSGGCTRQVAGDPRRPAQPEQGAVDGAGAVIGDRAAPYPTVGHTGSHGGHLPGHRRGDRTVGTEVGRRLVQAE